MLAGINALQDEVATDPPLTPALVIEHSVLVTDLLDSEHRTRLNIEMCDNMLAMLKELGL